MTIKQQGGVFGRNPTFNDVTSASAATNDLTVNANGTGLTISGNNTSAGSKNNLRFVDTDTSVASGQQVGRIEFYTSDAGNEGINAYIEGRDGSSSGSGSIVLGTGNSGAAVDRLELVSGGNLNLLTGNLVIGTSGNGIDFSATAGTGTSELFDDYEEGQAGGITLTPETSGSFTVNAALNTLAYTKVGRLVSITGMISCTNVSAVGTFVELDGLPFAAADLAETSGRFTGMAQFDGTSGSPSAVGYALEGWTKIRFPIDASTVTGNLYVNINYIAA